VKTQDADSDASTSPSDGSVTEIRATDDGGPGAMAVFPYDRMTVERFREAFPRARWSDALRAWHVPGKTAERRLDRWLGRELSQVLAYADARGKDAFAFDPIESPYLTAADGFEIRTPYSKTVRSELLQVPWAGWDADARVWRVPYRSWEELRRRWPTIEAAAQRNEPAALKQRRAAEKLSPAHENAQARARERRRNRYPVPVDALPPLGQILMTGRGAIAFVEITGECVEDEIAREYYPDIRSAAPLVWALWRRPSHEELVQVWPSRAPPTAEELQRGWWSATLDELRHERRKARSIERASATRQRARGAS
jgi:hypothetical protein